MTDVLLTTATCFKSASGSVSRRRMLQGGVGSSFILAFHVSVFVPKAYGQTPEKKDYPPNAFLRIDRDNKVTIQVSKQELGQGVLTALPMLLAEELGCAWKDVRAELAKAEDVYRDTVFGIQMVGGSTSVAHTHQQYREIGAKARLMLLSAAALRWNVDAQTCRTDAGVIFGPNGQRTTYGLISGDAARLPVPQDVRLKETKDFRIIGKPTTRLDTEAKSRGSQKFSIDFDAPNLLVALVSRPPTWGAKLARIQNSAAARVPGLVKIAKIPGDRGGDAVAVIADGFWMAKTARDALVLEWDSTDIERADSEALFKHYRELAQAPGLPAETADTTVIQSSARVIDATYEFPYLAHAPMEPLNMSIRFDGGRCTVWSGSQLQSNDRAAIAVALGIPVEKVELNTLMAGGGFGRRAQPASADAIEVAEIAKLVPGRTVKVILTREDDVRGGYYRPMHLHRVRVGQDLSGRITAWEHVVVGQSIMAGSPFESAAVKAGVDGTMVEGVRDSQYDIPNLALSVHHTKVNVPVLWWRSVGHSHTAFVMETMVDELAHAAKADPVAYRRALFGPTGKRSLEALDLAVLKSGYGKKRLAAGRAWGVAVHHAFDTSVAYVCEVSIRDGLPKVHRVTAGVHCNMPINPKTIEAQVQGGVVFGLCMLQPGYEITLKDGVVQQSNFGNYTPLYMGGAPNVDVHLVQSRDPPTGIGEPTVPPIAPAVANAMAVLTGHRVRRLPLPQARSA